MTQRIEAPDYLRILLKRRWFVLSIAATITLVGGLYAVSQPKMYRAAATVLLRRETGPIVWVGSGEQSSSPAWREPLEPETQARIAASLDCAELAAKALAERPRGEALRVRPEEILVSISVKPEKNDLLRIEATHSNPRYATEFANAIAEAFVQKNLELRRMEARAARVYLQDVLARASKALHQAQAAAARYQAQIRIITPDLEAQRLIERTQATEEALRQAEAELVAARHQEAQLQHQIATLRPYRLVRQPVPNPEREAKFTQLQQAETQLLQLQARYTEAWPPVQELRTQIEQLRREIAQLPETVLKTTAEPTPELGALRQQLLQLQQKAIETQARIQKLRAALAELRAAKQNLPPKLAELNRLLDQVELAKTAYRNIQAQWENARLNEAKEQPDAQVIDRASGAADISPRLSRMLLFALLLGLAAGVLLALLLEVLDDTIRTPEDLAAYTEVAFLGLVPRIEQTDQLVTVIAPKSPPAEAYRTLRSNIQFALVDRPAQTFLLTSAGAGEGKTVTAANLAVVFAQAGKRVLLIDSDLRRPQLHHLFHVSLARGLTNVLLGEATLNDVLLDTEVPGLRFSPAGPLPPNPAELLASDRMTQLIAEARSLADIVIFDSPPALILTDALILASKVERVLLVAEAGQVSRDAFNEMCRLIQNARGVILGAVLNKLRLTADSYYYYYYYYYYDYSHYDSQPQAEASLGSSSTVPSSSSATPPHSGASSLRPHPRTPNNHKNNAGSSPLEQLFERESDEDS